jgi:glutaredoxin-related protein
MIPDSCKALAPVDQFKKILSENKVVVLINGTLETPADDMSKSMLEKVNGLKCEYTAVDMIENKAFMEYFGDKK